ncbi:MAG: GAF domain-containing protein [Chloroflexi bacterium]|nr:GAF domain-containing protein [Chloroflexota bacterium]
MSEHFPKSEPAPTQRGPNTEVEALAQVAAAASSTLDLHSLLHMALQKMVEVSNSDAGFVVHFTYPSHDDDNNTEVISIPDTLSNGLEVTCADLEKSEDEAWLQIVSAQCWANALCDRLNQAGFTHTVAVPITAEEKIFGVCALGNRTRLAVRSTDLFVAMARQIGLAIENARTHATLREERDRLEILYDLGRRQSSSLQTEEVAQIIIQTAIQTVGVNRGNFWLLQNGNVVCIAEVTPAPDRLSLVGRSDPLKATRILRRLAVTRKPLIVNNVQDLVQAGVLAADRQSSYDIHSFLAVPVLYRDEVQGFLLVDKVGEQHTFTEQNAQFLSHLANQASLAVHNAKLFREVVREKKQVESVLSSFADGVCVVDTDYHIRHFSQGAEQLTGYRADKVIGKPCSTILGMRNENRQLLCGTEGCIIQQSALSANVATLPSYHRHTIQHRTGIAVPTFLTFTPWTDEAGMERGKVIALWDARGEERISQLKDEFLSMIGHELRTPINNISLASQLLRSQGANVAPETMQEALNIVEIQSKRLEHLARQIMDAAQLSVGELPVNVQPIALFPLLKRVATLAQPQLRNSRIIVEPGDAAPLSVIADEEHLVSILSHLVDNALKYGPDAQEVRLSAVYTPDQDFVDIQVRDQGPGINARHLERIFEKFYRIDSSDDRNVYGTGLGLFLSRKMVEAQGGTLTAESQVDKGSTFHVRLPVHHRLPQSTTGSA